MDEAFQVLDRIAHGVRIDSVDEGRWIPALTTIGWVFPLGESFGLTLEGVQAHSGLAKSQADGRRRARSLQLTD